MAEQNVSPTKRVPVMVLFDRSLIDRSDRVADVRFEGNRSLLIRTAVRELIERAELAERDAEAPVAA